MNIPGFTAEAALYQMRNPYRMGFTQSALDGTRGAVPQQRREVETNGGGLGYACLGPACACSGLEDCINCVLDQKCLGTYKCEGPTCVFWKL